MEKANRLPNPRQRLALNLRPDGGDRGSDAANWCHAPNSSNPASSWRAPRASLVQTGENTARESTEQLGLPAYVVSAASLPARPARRFARHTRIMWSSLRLRGGSRVSADSTTSCRRT
jgi:hypothetical protein